MKFLSLLLLSLLCALPASAFAQTTPSAQSLYDEGVTAYGKGDFATACPKFKASYDADKQPAPLFMLAKCEEKTGKIGSALVHFEEVLRVGGLENELRDQAARSVNDLAVRAPRLTLKRGTAPAAATAKVDGVLFTIDGRPEPVDPGEHQIEVSAPTHEQKTTKITIKEGDKLDIEITMGAPLPSTGPVAPPPVREAPPQKDVTPLLIGGGVAAGVGVIGFVIAGVTGGMILSECDGDLACPNREEDFDSGGLVIGNYVGFAVGGVGVATGAVLFIVAAVQSGTTEASVEAARVQPVAGPGDAGVGVRIAF
ncbi:MAG: hypothetical protein HOV80_25675 [Polyangiaceae bacterium]|nr:hypothetical protein [Polyangiaceae bacterium]